MAQLKDTLIQGSARVTDTLYATNIAGGTMVAPLVWKDNTALPEKTSADYFLAIDGFSSGGKTYWVSKANVLSSIGAAPSVSGGYLPLNGGTVSGTLILSKATDASGTANNSPALIVGGTATTNPHLELDGNEIMSKTSGTAVGPLYLNNDGGAVYINRGYGLTSVSTAVDDSGLRVYARRANNQGIIEAYNGYAAENGTYSWGYNHLTPNIAAGANTCLLTGVANSTNNQGALEFHYAGSNNDGNYVGLGLYSNNGLLKIFKDKRTEVDTLKIMNTSATQHLRFSREGWNYIQFPNNSSAVLAIGVGTVTTAGNAVGDNENQKLVIHQSGLVRPGGNDTQNLGETSHKWKGVYATDFYGSLQGNANTATSFSAAQKVYVTLGTASTTTTISGGSTSAQTIGVDGTLAVAHGGTGVTSFTNDCAVVSTGTTQTLVSRGLKITGGTNENVVISSYTSGKTLTIESQDTLILNKPAGSSISFRSAGNAFALFNRNGSLQIGGETDSTQTTYRVYIKDSNLGLTGRIAFNTSISAEKASISYDGTLHAIKFVVT